MLYLNPCYSETYYIKVELYYIHFDVTTESTNKKRIQNIIQIQLKEKILICIIEPYHEKPDFCMCKNKDAD